MPEPSIRTSRLAIAASLVVIVAAGATGFFIGRTTTPAIAPIVVELPPAPGPAVLSVEVPRVLGRADLLDYARRAADAFSSGQPLPEMVANASGRRFDLVLPFGCRGATAADSTAPDSTAADSAAPLRWRYDEARQTMRIRASVSRWQTTDWGLAATDGGKPLEGFWIDRPWSTAEQCPRAGGDTASLLSGLPLALGPDTLAIAEVVAGDRRTARRPYEVVKRIPADRLQAGDGFLLRLRGRLERLSDEGPIACVQPSGLNQPPLCLLEASFDEIRIENPLSGETLATWSTQAATSPTAQRGRPRPTTPG